MGTKRPHVNDSTLPESASRRAQPHAARRRKSDDFALPSTKAPSVNQLKSKIRDLTRALEHSDQLPAGVRIEKERALAGYKQDVEKVQEDKRKHELIKRYHMVRFFERQKATRAHKRLMKRLNASSPDTSEYKQVEKEMHDAEIDVNYTIYHPLTEKYQSLFSRQEDAEGGETAKRKLVAKKPIMWQVVEQCTAQGTLEALRDGKVATSISIGERKPSAPEKPRSKQDNKNGPAGLKSSKTTARQAQDDESDGGFFEE